MSIESIEQRLEMYNSRLQQGDGEGSLIGAMFIICKSRGTDIAALLAVAKAASDTAREMKKLVPGPGPRNLPPVYSPLPIAVRGMQHLDALESALVALESLP